MNTSEEPKITPEVPVVVATAVAVKASKEKFFFLFDYLCQYAELQKLLKNGYFQKFSNL